MQVRYTASRRAVKGLIWTNGTQMCPERFSLPREPASLGPPQWPGEAGGRLVAVAVTEGDGPAVKCWLRKVWMALLMSGSTLA